LIARIARTPLSATPGFGRKVARKRYRIPCDLFLDMLDMLVMLVMLHMPVVSQFRNMMHALLIADVNIAFVGPLGVSEPL